MRLVQLAREPHQAPADSTCIFSESFPADVISLMVKGDVSAGVTARASGSLRVLIESLLRLLHPRTLRTSVPVQIRSIRGLSS